MRSQSERCVVRACLLYMNIFMYGILLYFFIIERQQYYRTVPPGTAYSNTSLCLVIGVRCAEEFGDRYGRNIQQPVIREIPVRTY